MLTPYSLPAPDFHLELSKKHQFDSFEQMRQQGSKQLETLTPGKVGILKGKKQQYRIVTESDFQSLIGAVAHLQALQQQLQVVMKVSQTVIRHQDQVTIEALEATLYGLNQFQPIQSGPGELEMDTEIDSDDEVLLDPEQIYAQMDH